MELREIEQFGVEPEVGISLLVDVFLYAYDSMKCGDCGMIHEAPLKDLLLIVTTCPEGQQEREFLFFMAGTLINDGTYWTLVSILLRSAEENKFTSASKRRLLGDFIRNNMFPDNKSRHSSH
jgi:hypothetical protein